KLGSRFENCPAVPRPRRVIVVVAVATSLLGIWSSADATPTRLAVKRTCIVADCPAPNDEGRPETIEKAVASLVETDGSLTIEVAPKVNVALPLFVMVMLCAELGPAP